jgi:hypothetical protein
MNRWFNRLVALLARRSRTVSTRRVDWRGRPLAGRTGGASPRVSGSDGALYATLCVASFDDASQAPRLSGHGDQKREMKQ